MRSARRSPSRARKPRACLPRRSVRDCRSSCTRSSFPTRAVLRPAAFYFLRDTHVPPVAALREAGIPMAVATDCNPGTSPTTSLLLTLNMACTLFRLTPAEALAGVTRHAARALGLADRGTLAVGKRADIALWNVDEPAELAYRIGGNACAGVVRAGRFDVDTF